MPVRMRSLFLSSLFSLIPLIAQAQQEAMPGTSVSLLLGFSAAGVASVSERPEIEVDKRGFDIAGHALASLAVARVVMDLGAGWYLSNVYGKARQVQTPEGIDQDEIYTRAGFGEFGASYRFAEDWLFGPMARFTFGTETSYSPFDFSTKTPRVLVGPRLAFQPPIKAGGFRVALFGLTDLNIDQRQVYLAGLSFDFILPIIKADVVTEEKIVEKEKIVEVEKEVIVEKPVEVEKVVNTESFIHTLDGSILNFETDRAVLLPQSVVFLRKLGAAFVKNSDAWTTLEIQGHTDERGEDAYNLDLSNRRAESVAKALAAAGVDSARMSAKGFGETKPIDSDNTEMAWARNRRVELVFSGATDAKRLANIFDQIKRETYVPQSCGPAGCK
jgi:outer membrane protein OmpA-like peptidoglycan-associated protein